MCTNHFVLDLTFQRISRNGTGRLEALKMVLQSWQITLGKVKREVSEEDSIA